MKSLQLYERVARLALEIQSKVSCRIISLILLSFSTSTPRSDNGPTNWTRLETLALGSALSTFQAQLPSITDVSSILPYEEDNLSSLNTQAVNAHATCQGSILLLYSLNDDDFGSRSLAFEGARSLAELCNQIRRAGGLKAPKGFIVPLVSVPFTLDLIITAQSDPNVTNLTN